MLGLKLIHVGKRDPWSCNNTSAIIFIRGFGNIVSPITCQDKILINEWPLVLLATRASINIFNTLTPGTCVINVADLLEGALLINSGFLFTSWGIYSCIFHTFMMTSSNGNIFRVTGHLCGKFTGPGEFPAQRTVTRSFDVCFDLRLNKRLSKQS